MEIAARSYSRDGSTGGIEPSGGGPRRTDFDVAASGVSRGANLALARWHGQGLSCAKAFACRVDAISTSCPGSPLSEIWISYTGRPNRRTTRNSRDVRQRVQLLVAASPEMNRPTAYVDLISELICVPIITWPTPRLKACATAASPRGRRRRWRAPRLAPQQLTSSRSRCRSHSTYQPATVSGAFPVDLESTADLDGLSIRQLHTLAEWAGLVPAVP